jgi:lipoic acid synthetase
VRLPETGCRRQAPMDGFTACLTRLFLTRNGLMAQSANNEILMTDLPPVSTFVPELQPVKRTERYKQGEKLRDADKVERIPVKVIASDRDETQRKPDWIRVRIPASPEVDRIKSILRKNKLSSVCEEANCPNLGECFSGGTATFMIMGDICTRRCPFCDVGHGKPNPLDEQEPRKLAEAIAEMRLKYVVITSVDRDDLRDGGAQHFADCIREARALSPKLQVEVLVPDFRGRMDIALDILEKEAPDVFNHNMETVSRLYRQARPGANYEWSLELLKQYKARRPDVLTKSGLMVGLGETKEEIIEVMKHMREHDIDMLTIGQYLQPSKDHLPVERFVHPDEFAEYTQLAEEMGFKHAACGPLVRSSYHADKQAHGEDVKWFGETKTN